MPGTKMCAQDAHYLGYMNIVTTWEQIPNIPTFSSILVLVLCFSTPNAA